LPPVSSFHDMIIMSGIYKITLSTIKICFNFNSRDCVNKECVKYPLGNELKIDEIKKSGKDGVNYE